jgi:hypothetical protein
MTIELNSHNSRLNSRQRVAWVEENSSTVEFFRDKRDNDLSIRMGSGQKSLLEADGVFTDSAADPYTTAQVQWVQKSQPDISIPDFSRRAGGRCEVFGTPQPVLVKRLQPLLASRPEKDFARRRRPVLLTHYEGAPFQSRL